MRRTVGVALTVILAAAALGIWIQSAFIKMKPNGITAAEASSTPLLPSELMRNADKNLPAEAHGEPF